MSGGRYYGGGPRGRRLPRAGTVRANKYAATCAICDGDLAPGDGIVTYRDGIWLPTHVPTRWHGSPTGGGWVGGCPTTGAAGES